MALLHQFVHKTPSGVIVSPTSYALTGVTQSEINNVNQNKLKRQLFYWTPKLRLLMHEKVIIFYAFENNALIKLKNDLIIEHMMETGIIEYVDAIYRLPNPHFIYVLLESKEKANLFMQQTNFIAQKRIQFIENQNLQKNIKITIENFPKDTLEKHLQTVLKPWGQVDNIIPSYFIKSKEKKINYGQTFIDFTLKDDYSMYDVPYFIEILSFKIYLNIKGKSKICFRCHASDHLISQCQNRFCPKCRQVLPIRHDCVQTYASKLAGQNKNIELAMQESLEDENLKDLADQENNLDNSNQSDFSAFFSTNQFKSLNPLFKRSAPLNKPISLQEEVPQPQIDELNLSQPTIPKNSISTLNYHELQVTLAPNTLETNINSQLMELEELQNSDAVPITESDSKSDETDPQKKKKKKNKRQKKKKPVKMMKII